MGRIELDINCDLGEGESTARTRALMRHITSANVACGGHAGDADSMARCVRLAGELGVRLGAHPGPLSRGDFGRGALQPSAEELTLLVLHQASALQQVASRFGLPLHHIKLHGALYHASEADEALALAYARAVGRYFPGVKIYSRSGGRVARVARRLGVAVFEELFADRAYLSSGELVPRQESHAVLTRPGQITARLGSWLSTGHMETTDGPPIRLAAQTICVHGDTHGASRLARLVRDRLSGAERC